MQEVKIYKNGELIPNKEEGSTVLSNREIDRILDRFEKKDREDKENFSEIKERLTRVETYLEKQQRLESVQEGQDDRIGHIERKMNRMYYPVLALLLLASIILISSAFGIPVGSLISLGFIL